MIEFQMVNCSSIRRFELRSFCHLRSDDCILVWKMSILRFLLIVNAYHCLTLIVVLNIREHLLWSNCMPWTSRIFVLSAFNGNLLVFANSSTLDTSFDNCFSRSEICLWSDDAMMVVSSANKYVCDCICKGRPVIKLF